MTNVTEKFSPEFKFSGEGGSVISLSIEKKEVRGFDGYYVSAKCDRELDAECALMLRAECPDIPFTAIYSHSLYWVQPHFGERAEDIPEKSAAVIFKNPEGDYTYVMTVTDTQYKTYIRGERNTFALQLYSQLPSRSIDNQRSFIVGRGKSAVELVREGARAMCELLGNGLKLREEKAMPEMLEYFGWCSWDAFQIRVDHEGLLLKAREFSDKGVPVKYAIIDDMWGDAPNLKTSKPEDSFSDMVKVMHATSLRSFEGDPERFPRGLGAAVADLKAAGIPSVGLWFPTTGYWYGLTEGGPAYRCRRGTLSLAQAAE